MECSSTYRRFSMNTSLKNARIFDDDSWDAESAGFIIKKEPIEPGKEEETNNSFNESVTVKKEITEDTYNSSLEECAGPYEPSYPDNLNLNVKTEVFEPTTNEKSAKDVDKKEIRDIPNDANKINWSFAHFRHGNADVKDEAEDDFDEDSMFEESYLDNIDPKVKKEIISTPNKFDKRDWPTEDSNPSPFNKELFKNFSLKQEENDSPDLRERIFQSSGSKAKKEARKNFLASPRISPYRRSSVGDAVANRLSVKKRLGPQLPSDIPKSESKQEARRNYSLSRSPRNSPYRKGSVGETAPHPISVKRRLGPRDTPNYKHEENRGPELREKSQQRSNSPEIQEARKQFSSSVSAKKRLGPALSSDIPKKKPCKQEMETDPEILSRRQKQIDYGKNTMGYDNYIKKVPRQERTREDPQTPNRFVKYSRRGWDGLIKQWRIKLHKYDTADS